MTKEYKTIDNDTRLMKNTKAEGPYLELEGICRGVVCAQSGRDESCYSYCGILQRANGELLEFSGIGFRLESVIVKASSEMEMPVSMQCFFNKYALVVGGLKMGNIKSQRYEE